MHQAGNPSPCSWILHPQGPAWDNRFYAESMPQYNAALGMVSCIRGALPLPCLTEVGQMCFLRRQPTAGHFRIASVGTWPCFPHEGLVVQTARSAVPGTLEEQYCDLVMFRAKILPPKCATCSAQKVGNSGPVIGCEISP